MRNFNLTANETPHAVTPRRAIALTVGAAAAVLAMSGEALAAGGGTDGQSAGHAFALFAIAWFLASLRLRRQGLGWRVGFQPSPLRDLPAFTIPATQEGKAS
jgi:hypothetical protein